MRLVSVIVEKHDDGFVAYPVGMKGIVVAEGETAKEALDEVESAIAFHLETFGPEVIEDADIQEVTLETLQIAS